MLCMCYVIEMADLKEYNVDFDMKFSHDFRVRAKNKTDAKKKAFAKFLATRNKISQYNVWVDEV